MPSFTTFLKGKGGGCCAEAVILTMIKLFATFNSRVSFNDALALLSFFKDLSRTHRGSLFRLCHLSGEKESGFMKHT